MNENIPVETTQTPVGETPQAEATTPALLSSKPVKLVAIVIAVVLALLLITSIFGDKNAKKAEKELKSQITQMLEEGDYTNIKVKTKAVGKNKDADLYCFDTTVTCKSDGEKEKSTSYIIVFSDGEDVFVVNQYEYKDENKKDIKEIALASLAKG